MTLGELIDWLSVHPFYVVAYFLWIPLTALIAGWVAKGEGHLSPWKYLYSVLIYLICVPGILAVGLNIYLFLFERISVFQSDLFTQVLPILSMVGTLLIIKRQVPLEYIPGFDRLSGLMMLVGATILVMWFMDRVRIYVFSFMRFEYLILVFVAIFLVLRVGMKRVFGGQSNPPDRQPR